MIGNPWILGLYALAGTVFVAGARMAGWYGAPSSARLLAPFFLIAGAVQLMAAMRAYERRNAAATAMLGVWGMFWFGYGILAMPFFGPVPSLTGASSEIAFWLIVLAATTWMGALAASAESWALAIGLAVVALASTLGAIGQGLGLHGFELVAGWLFALGGLVTWYTATAMMLETALGDETLPLGRSQSIPSPAADTARQPVITRRVS